MLCVCCVVTYLVATEVNVGFGKKKKSGFGRLYIDKRITLLLKQVLAGVPFLSLEMGTVRFRSLPEHDCAFSVFKTERFMSLNTVRLIIRLKRLGVCHTALISCCRWWMLVKSLPTCRTCSADHFDTSHLFLPLLSVVLTCCSGLLFLAQL